MKIQYSSRTFFTYETDYDSALAPGASVELVFNTHGDSDFFWQKFAAFALVADAGTSRSADQVPALLVTVTNETTGRSYSNVPMSVPNTASNGQFVPMMTVWPRKSTISVLVTNANGVGHTTYSEFQLSFLGTKAFT